MKTETFPTTHVTFHAPGLWSLVHNGNPLCAPQSQERVRTIARRFFPKAESFPVWVAGAGKFVTTFTL